MNNQLPTNEQIAQYLDNDIPLQQHDYDTIIDIETDVAVKSFLDARLIFTKSKHSKRAKQKKCYIERIGILFMEVTNNER